MTTYITAQWLEAAFLGLLQGLLNFCLYPRARI